MGLIKTFFTNCAHPKGGMGRAMLKFMNWCHAPLTNWGLSFVEIKDGWTMLDIGCGGGATLQRLLKRSKNGKVYGIDISEESVAKAKKVNAEVLDKQVFVCQGSAEKLPYENGKFDLVTAVETVYFWKDPEIAFRHIKRVLKPGGTFVILAEASEPSNESEMQFDTPMTIYTADELIQIMEKTGFVNCESRRGEGENIMVTGVKESE